MLSPIAIDRMTKVWNHTPSCGDHTPEGCRCGLPEALAILGNVAATGDQWLRCKARLERRLNVIRNTLDGHYDDG